MNQYIIMINIIDIDNMITRAYIYDTNNSHVSSWTFKISRWKNIKYANTLLNKPVITHNLWIKLKQNNIKQNKQKKNNHH